MKCPLRDTDSVLVLSVKLGQMAADRSEIRTALVTFGDFRQSQGSCIRGVACGKKKS